MSSEFPQLPAPKVECVAQAEYHWHPGEAGGAAVMYRWLRCVTCSRHWELPVRRGRYPNRCAECKTAVGKRS